MDDAQLHKKRRSPEHRRVKLCEPHQRFNFAEFYQREQHTQKKPQKRTDGRQLQGQQTALNDERPVFPYTGKIKLQRATPYRMNSGLR
jgi:hypothetical protein